MGKDGKSSKIMHLKNILVQFNNEQKITYAKYEKALALTLLSSVEAF